MQTTWSVPITYIMRIRSYLEVDKHVTLKTQRASWTTLHACNPWISPLI
jgi:hypothetical protein